MIVLDASVILEVLLRTPAATLLDGRLFNPHETLHAPHLIDIEVAQVLRRYAMRRQSETERCREALSDLADFPLSRYSHELLLPRIWELRANMTAYDAAYVALAEVLEARLLTRDHGLAHASGHRATIELV